MTDRPVSPTVSIEPSIFETPTIEWDSVTLLPFNTREPEPEEPVESVEGEKSEFLGIPDPLTEDDQKFLIAQRLPFEMNETEITLGRLALPVDLLSIRGVFSIESLEVVNYPGWRFLAFDLPLPTEGELGMIVRAPISGKVLAGKMEMINNQTAQTISIDHPLGDDQLLRMTFVYSGEIEVLFVMGQQVRPGEVLFRLTRDTGQVHYLGSTPVLQPDGAVLTLHASIDTVAVQESGVESLKFLRPLSLTPSNFLQDYNGRIISPSSN